MTVSLPSAVVGQVLLQSAPRPMIAAISNSVADNTTFVTG